MSVTVAFRYGSPHTESTGDCTLTEDNNYMLVLFNTRHHVNRTSYSTVYTKPIDYNFVYPTINGDFDDPYEYNSSYSNCAVTGGNY